MASELDALWSEFAAETEEHLDALERLLSDRRRADWTRDDIGALFRYFHSLKGTFLAMGFVNVEAVAHHCEDILSLVREGRTRLDGGLSQVLLSAVDRLKGMREEVIGTRQDAAPAGKLLRELARHGQSGSAPTPEPAPIPAADMPLAEDPEMLAIYSELLDQRLPGLALAAAADSTERASAAETAGELAYGAEMMGFAALADELHAVAEQAAASGGTADRAALIRGFAELIAQAKIIEEVTQIPSGAAPFAMALAAQLIPDYQIRLEDLGAAASRLDEDESAPEKIVTAAQAMRTVAACLGHEQTARLLLLVEERFHAAQTQEAGHSAAFGDLARESIEALRAHVEAGQDLDADHADLLVQQWEATFQEPGGNAAAATAAERRLRPELLATLSAEQRTRLERNLGEGRRAYELLFELEAHPDIAGDLIAWLSSAVETITSRTVLRDGANCFEFLIFCEHPTDWVNAQLAALDPERACLRGILALDEAGVPAATSGETHLPIRAPLIRVHSESIDELMAEVGEMRTALASLSDIVRHGRIATAVHDARRFAQHQARQDPALRQQLDAMEGDLRELKALENTLDAAHRRIWGAGLQLRVIPVDALFGRLARAARDLAQKLGKDIDVVLEGREVRIDKSMVDALIDPLMHMVRNAVDHGIEAPERRQAVGKSSRARLSISAAERGNSVDIVIADDGRGLDRSKILAKALSLGMVAPHQIDQMAERDVNTLIFQPGFSTAEAVTEISGRGVGMDVVAATLQRLGGVIDMETSSGVGTRFILRLPVSAALLRTLLVEVEDQIFALPERQVVRVMEQATQALEEIAGREVIIHRGAAVPVQPLACALGFETQKPRTPFTQLVIVSTGARMLGLSVDRVLRFQDLFLKELHPMLAALPVVAGASVLGDGRPVLVLDARGLGSFGPVGDGEPAAAPT